MICSSWPSSTSHMQRTNTAHISHPTHLSVRDDLRAVDGRTTGTHVDCYRVSVRLYFLTLLPYKGNMRKSASARARATALRSARRFTPPCALGQPFNSGDISNFPAASSMPSIDASISCTSKSPDIISKCRDSILTLSSPSAGGSRGCEVLVGDSEATPWPCARARSPTRSTEGECAELRLAGTRDQVW